jgi:hypothetical protein
MSVTLVKGMEVIRPDTVPLKSSVLDHAQAAGSVVENDHFGLTNNQGLWPSYNCLDTLVPTAMCPDPLGSTKVFAFAEWQPALDFAVYGAVQCSNVGLDTHDMLSEIERVFSLNEGKGVEQALLLNRFVATDSDAEVQWEAPVDLTPVGPTGLLSAYACLAVLEGYAAANYSGQPTIHMPRAVATLLEVSGLIVWQGDLAFTKNGAKVAMGGGYDTSESDGTWDMFATGEVYVERSEQFSAHAYAIPGDGLNDTDSSDPNQFTDNSSLAIAERMFRVAVDCFVAKATVKVW